MLMCLSESRGSLLMLDIVNMPRGTNYIYLKVLLQSCFVCFQGAHGY